MAIFHQELGQVCTTMYLQGSAADNTVCKMHANDTVAACAAGNDFIGVVVGKRDGLACVQVAGFVTLHYTGTTAPTVGECALAGDGKGGVAVPGNAKKYREDRRPLSVSRKGETNMAFDNIHLEKGMYHEAGRSFTQVLEQLDPSEGYRGTPLENTDAFQRQLKRFGIRVKGAGSDTVEKFFSTFESAVLFPEFLARACLLYTSPSPRD